MRFGIVGYGSFGRLLAEVLSPHGEVLVHKRSKDGKQAGKNVRFADLEEVASADVVILAIGLESFDDVCSKLAPLVKPDTTVADVCSVKIKPIEIMNRYLAGKCRILATHPLFGTKTADAGSLKDKKIVICGEKPENY